MNIPFALGWEEWVALPDLGLPALKAKVDTGARTSALHARLIERFGPADTPMVRFVVHPVPGREDIEVVCASLIVDQREVVSSNGDSETRFVIRERMRIGAREWLIEITLANRSGMNYRMLLGRQAIQSDMRVEPAASFRQPKLSYRPYRQTPRPPEVSRALRIGVLTRAPHAPAVRHLRERAMASGHVVEALDPSRIALTFANGAPGLTVGGLANPHYDAVLARARNGRRTPMAALARQFDLMGSFTLNSGDALDRIRTSEALWQCLVRAGLPLAPLVATGGGRSAFAPAPPGRTLWRLVMLGGRAMAIVVRREGRLWRAGAVPDALEALARRAAMALGLGLFAIDIGEAPECAPEDRPAPSFWIWGVSIAPALSRIERVTGAPIADDVIRYIESHVRSGSRPRPEPPPEETPPSE